MGPNLVGEDRHRPGGDQHQQHHHEEPEDAVRPGLADRKSTRLNSSHTEIYTLSPTRRSSDLHGTEPSGGRSAPSRWRSAPAAPPRGARGRGTSRTCRSEEHTSELQSHRDLHSFPYTTLFRPAWDRT